MIHFKPVEHHIEDRAHARLCDGRPASDADISSSDWGALRDAGKDATLCPDCQDKVNPRDVRSDLYGYDRMSNTLEVGFCIAALKEALSKGQPEIFNTDQGSQFTSEAFCGLLLERGIKVSMDGKGRYLDNIFVERLWRSVKYEEVYLKAYRNGSEARRGIDAYLDLYNRERPHQSLGYRTPAQVFAEGRPLRCLPEQASTLSSHEVVSDFPAGVSLNLASSLS